MDYEKPDLLNPDIGFVQGNLAGEGLCESLESTFDVVTAWAVIEHVPDPARAIECLVRMVRPGGYVMLSTPEVGTLLTRYAGGRTRWFCPPEHLHLVSPRGIKFLFGRQGCDVLRCARLELNPLRWVGRYGIGLAEAVLGATVKSVSTSRWERRRLERMLRFQGIIYCVIRKRQQPERSEVLH
jgi:SAM-dependent methyltransferase